MCGVKFEIKEIEKHAKRGSSLNAIYNNNYFDICYVIEHEFYFEINRKKASSLFKK